MADENGQQPKLEPLTLELPPAQGHIVISMLADGTADLKLLGNTMAPMVACWLLEMAKDTVKAMASAANKPRIAQPGSLPPRPGPGSPGWRR
jgi:hypothetical protein